MIKRVPIYTTCDNLSQKGKERKLIFKQIVVNSWVFRTDDISMVLNSQDWSWGTKIKNELSFVSRHGAEAWAVSKDKLAQTQQLERHNVWYEMQLSTANLQEIETGIWIQRTQTKIKTAMRLNWLAALRQLTNITLPHNNKLETDFHLVASGMVWILVPNTVQRKRIPMVQTAANRLK